MIDYLQKYPNTFQKVMRQNRECVSINFKELEKISFDDFFLAVLYNCLKNIKKKGK